MVVETAEPAIGNTAGDGVRHGACGILGGDDGMPHRYTLSFRQPRAAPDQDQGNRPRRSAPATGSSSNPAAAAAGATRPGATPQPSRRRRERVRDEHAGMPQAPHPHPRRSVGGELRRPDAPSPGRLRASHPLPQCGRGGYGGQLIACTASASMSAAPLPISSRSTQAAATTLAKVPSTPEDPSLGVLDGLAAAGRARSASIAPRCSAETDRIVHGTTVATNALLEHKGARLGLLTTEGHRDVIEMREGLKDDRYNLRMPPPEQLVPRRLRLRVRERDARRRPRRDAARSSLARRGDRRVAARSGSRRSRSAICTPGATRATSAPTARRCSRALPDAYVSLSSEVLPQIKEFERVSTTIINAYVGPVLSRYLARLEARLAEAGYRGPTLIIQSHGGVAPIAEAGPARRRRGAVGAGRRGRRQRLRGAA